MNDYYYILDGIMKEEIRAGHRIAIYPLGKVGLIAKGICLSRYGQESIDIDNEIKKYNAGVIGIDDFEEIDSPDITIILCASAPALNDKLMENLRKRNLKAHIRNILNSVEVIIDHSEKEEYFKRIKDLCLVKKAVGFDLVRIGNEHDDGYVMLDDFGNSRAAYSFGIGNNVSWEEEIV